MRVLGRLVTTTLASSPLGLLYSKLNEEGSLKYTTHSAFVEVYQTIIIIQYSSSPLL